MSENAVLNFETLTQKIVIKKKGQERQHSGRYDGRKVNIRWCMPDFSEILAHNATFEVDNTQILLLPLKQCWPDFLIYPVLLKERYFTCTWIVAASDIDVEDVKLEDGTRSDGVRSGW